MRTRDERSTKNTPRRLPALLAVFGIAAVLAFGGAAGASAAETSSPLDGVIAGGLDGFLEDATTQKEGCAYTPLLVPVVANVFGHEPVEGCGYFENDPAHPNHPDNPANQ